MRKHAIPSLVLLVISHIVRLIWLEQHLPYEQIMNYFPVPFAIYAALSLHLWKKEIERITAKKQQKKQQLKEHILALCDTTSLRDDLSPDDLTSLYEIDELEKIADMLQALPKGHRRLQDVLDIVDRSDEESAT